MPSCPHYSGEAYDAEVPRRGGPVPSCSARASQVNLRPSRPIRQCSHPCTKINVLVTLLPSHRLRSTWCPMSGRMSRGHGHGVALARLERQRAHDDRVADLKGEVALHSRLKGRAHWEMAEVRPPPPSTQPWPNSDDMPRALRHDPDAWESAPRKLFGSDGLVARQSRALAQEQTSSTRHGGAILSTARSQVLDRKSHSPLPIERCDLSVLDVDATSDLVEEDVTHPSGCAGAANMAQPAQDDPRCPISECSMDEKQPSPHNLSPSKLLAAWYSDAVAAQHAPEQPGPNIILSPPR